MLAFFLPITVVLVAFTLLPLWRHEAWWVRALAFPRLQLFTMSLALILMLLSGDLSSPSTWGMLIAALACCIFQGWWILPYTRLFPVEVAPADTLDRAGTIRVITANVLMSNRNADALISLVHEHVPDVLVTLESDAWWQARLDALAQDYPHTLKCPLDNLYGMHVYSRLPLSESRIEYLVEPDVPSMHTLVHLRSGKRIRMHFLHPAPPSPTENDLSSARDAELIIVAGSVADTDDPVIVTGDLNDVAWSATTRLFRKISGLLDPRVGRGMFNTFHAGYWFMRWPLDHLFHSHHFTLAEIRRMRGFGSDHFALLTELVLTKAHNADQAGLEADAEDQRWADDKADAQGVDKADVPESGGRQAPLAPTGR